jgi:hypothetical protein
MLFLIRGWVPAKPREQRTRPLLCTAKPVDCYAVNARSCLARCLDVLNPRLNLRLCLFVVVKLADFLCEEPSAGCAAAGGARTASAAAAAPPPTAFDAPSPTHPLYVYVCAHVVCVDCPLSSRWSQPPHRNPPLDLILAGVCAAGPALPAPAPGAAAHCLCFCFAAVVRGAPPARRLQAAQGRRTDNSKQRKHGRPRAFPGVTSL